MNYDSRRLVIVDFDEVICQLHKEWIDRYNAWNGTEFSTSDWTRWDWHESNQDVNANSMMAVLDDPDLYENVKPVPGAVAGLRMLTDMGVPWVIATSVRTMGQALSKKSWLLRHGVIEPGQSIFDKVFFTRHKYLLHGAVMIDDCPHYLEKFEGSRILFDAPYNQDVDLGLRAHSWLDVITYVRNLTRPLGSA